MTGTIERRGFLKQFAATFAVLWGGEFMHVPKAAAHREAPLQAQSATLRENCSFVADLRARRQAIGYVPDSAVRCPLCGDLLDLSAPNF